MFFHHNLTLPIQALAALRAADMASREVLEICSAIVREIINSAAREESFEDVFDAFEDILAIDSPGLHFNSFFWDLPTDPMELKLEERNELLQTPPSQGFNSPTALPPPFPPLHLHHPLSLPQPLPPNSLLPLTSKL